MVYLFLVFFVFGYSYFFRMPCRALDILIGYSPIFLAILLVISLQYEVGTDYSRYLDVASGVHSSAWIEKRWEYGFLAINNLVIYLEAPQLIFFFNGLMQVVLLFIISYELRKKSLAIHWFLLLYFVFCLTFYNSLNGIRQYTAVYFVALAVIYLLEGLRLRFLILCAIAALFHFSALFFLPMLLVRRVLLARWNFGYVLILISLCSFPVVFLEAIWFDFISFLVSLTPYKSYIDGSYFAGRASALNIATKIPKIAIVLFCGYILKYYYKDLADRYNSLLNLSFLSVMVLILSLANPILWRYYQYFDVFSVFPLLVLLTYKRERSIVGLILSVLLIIWILKVTIFARGEYQYSSILLNSFS